MAPTRKQNRLCTGLVDWRDGGRDLCREGQQSHVLVQIFQSERQAALVQESPGDLSRSQVQLRRGRRRHVQSRHLSRVARRRRTIHVPDGRQGDVGLADRWRCVMTGHFSSSGRAVGLLCECHFQPNELDHAGWFSLTLPRSSSKGKVQFHRRKRKLSWGVVGWPTVARREPKASIIDKKPSYRWGTARRGLASWNLVKFCTNVDDLYLKSSETRLLPIRL